MTTRSSGSTGLALVALAGVLMILALAVPRAAAAPPALEVTPPPGWRIKTDEPQLTLLPPAKSLFVQAILFDQPFLLSPDVMALEMLAAAAFPEGKSNEKVTGRRTALEGYTAVEVWGTATAANAPYSLGAWFVWKGTRMVHVVVLARGSDPAPARKIGETLARGAKLRETATFFPVPGAPRGVLAPAAWRPSNPDTAHFLARVVANDPPPEPSGTIRYEVLPAGYNQPIGEVLKGIEALAQSVGGQVTRTDGLETRVEGRRAIVFQQLLQPPRALFLGAIIFFPETVVRVTYFDRRERAAARRAMVDQLITRVARAGIKAKPPMGKASRNAAANTGVPVE